jgi:hypothetical protein
VQRRVERRAREFFDFLVRIADDDFNARIREEFRGKRVRSREREHFLVDFYGGYSSSKFCERYGAVTESSANVENALVLADSEEARLVSRFFKRRREARRMHFDSVDFEKRFSETFFRVEAERVVSVTHELVLRRSALKCFTFVLLRERCYKPKGL